MKTLLSASVLLLCAAPSFAAGQMRITEWMYKGTGGEFIEFTNVGDAPVDMTGWSYDDDSELPGTVALSAFGVVQPGVSVILAEDSAATFVAQWNLGAVTVIGDLTTNLGANDEINLYDDSNVLVDRLKYGVTSVPGSIATLNFSGWTNIESVGANDAIKWKLSAAGDAQNSVTSTKGDVGNPGSFLQISNKVTTYGTACAGSGGIAPKLALYGIPALGNTVTFEVTNGLGGTNAFVFFGNGPAALPIQGGCFLNVTPLLPVFLPLTLGGVGPGAGSFSASTTLTATVPGNTVTMQAFTLDAGVAQGFAASQGVSILFQ